MFTWQDLPGRKPQGYEKAAERVKQLFQGEPVRTVAVAALLGKRTDDGDTARMLRRAVDAGLVARVGRSGWVPVELPRQGEQ
jgi:hypothetical protein